ncbi:hypothetical protein [Streptomyces sp. NPDC058412]|uniref:hypothetical protein n=2 Tax=unclassified Streptomyces TaxID=2593676 RepID=UPI0036671179
MTSSLHGGHVPQDIEFHLPFPSSLSPDLAGARQRNPAWVRGTGLVGEGRSHRRLGERPV